MVKRFEDEIDSLRLQKSELELEMDLMRTEKKKADSKIGELKGRWVLKYSFLLRIVRTSSFEMQNMLLRLTKAL